MSIEKQRKGYSFLSFHKKNVYVIILSRFCYAELRHSTEQWQIDVAVVSERDNDRTVLRRAPFDDSEIALARRIATTSPP